MREVERRVMLSVLDRKWREHLYEMDYLKEGIGLRAMAQRDPLVEYQREGFLLWQAMNESVKEEAVGSALPRRRPGRPSPEAAPAVAPCTSPTCSRLWPVQPARSPRRTVMAPSRWLHQLLATA
jgi:preprotein translocase subunit SecA